MVVEDKDLGLKIASPEEAMWLKVKESTEKLISNMEQELQVQKLFLETVTKKCDEYKQSG